MNYTAESDRQTSSSRYTTQKHKKSCNTQLLHCYHVSNILLSISLDTLSSPCLQRVELCYTLAIPYYARLLCFTIKVMQDSL